MAANNRVKPTSGDSAGFWRVFWLQRLILISESDLVQPTSGLPGALVARGVLSLRRKKINKHLRVQVLTRDRFKCRMCGRSRDEVSLEVDHIIPVSQGGTDELQNLATLCRDCNAGKSDYKFPDYASMTLIPDNLEAHFKFFHDPKQGDNERYHLYCYFQQAGGSLSS